MSATIFVLVREMTDNPSTIIAASRDRARLVDSDHVPEPAREDLARRESVDVGPWEALAIYEVELI